MGKDKTTIKLLVEYIEQLEDYYESSRHLIPVDHINTKDSVRNYRTAREWVARFQGIHLKELAPYSNFCKRIFEAWTKGGKI